MTAPDPDATVDLTAVLTTAGTTAWEAVDELALLLEVAASHADLSNMSADLTPKDRKRLRAAQSRLDHYPWPTRNQQRVVSTFVNDLLRTRSRSQSTEVLGSSAFPHTTRTTGTVPM